MIPVRLELEAFLPFRTHQVLDFDPLNQAGMFLVCGNTGSGKTSIFDAVCYALYGETSGSDRDTSCLKSQLAEDASICWVELTFDSQGERYRIRRTPKQLRLKRGGNLSESLASAELTLPGGEVLTKTNEVNQRMIDIIGLQAGQFKKIVMLPQGEFRRFLSDSSRDKQEILRKLFGTEACDRIAEQLREQDNALSAELSRLRDRQLYCMRQLEALDNADLAAELQKEAPDSRSVQAFAESLQDSLSEALLLQQEQLQQAQTALHRIDLPGAEQFNLKLQRYREAKARLSELQGQAKRKEEDRTLLETLGHVREVFRVADGIRQLASELEQVKNRLDTWKEQLPVANERYQQALLTNDAAQEAQAKSPELTARLQQEKEQLARFSQFRTLKQTLAAQTQDLLLLQQAAERFAMLSEQQRLTEHREQLQQLQQEEIAVALQQQQTTEALQQWQQLQHLFFQHQAALLAADLKEGTPCPVCGSTEHPAPATPEEQPVSRVDLEESADRYESLRTRLNELQAALAHRQAILSSADSPTLCFTETIAALDTLARQLDALPASPHYQAFQQADLDREHGRLTGLLEQTRIQNSALQKLLREGKTESELILSIQVLEAEITRRSTHAQATAKQVQETAAECQKLTAALQEAAQFQTQREEHLSRQQTLYETLLSDHTLKEAQLPTLAKQLPLLASLQSSLAAFDRDMAAASAVTKELSAEFAEAEPVDLEALRRRRLQLNEECHTLQSQYEASLQTHNNNSRRLEELSHISEQHTTLSAHYGELHLLFMAASGRNPRHLSFERYVLAHYFDRVIEQANLRLHAMTGGRYHLRRVAEHERGNTPSGLDLEVFDAYSGRYRPVSSLSGGESFKTALCMALGLADSIAAHTGGVEIGTIFIDEGFGSLDQSALEQAIDCLFSLREHGRIIGIISHVDTLRERIPAKVLVSRDPLGSTIAVQV